MRLNPKVFGTSGCDSTLSRYHFDPTSRFLLSPRGHMTYGTMRTGKAIVSKGKNSFIIELGYVREGFAAAKQEEKRAQHSLLKYLLQDLGWRVRYHTITLGVTGTVYNDSIACLRELQLSHSAQEQTVRSWVHMTLNHTHGLVTQRRQLDSHFINAAFKKPP